MDTVKVKNIVIGEGMPKICVPIVGNTIEEILSMAEKIKEIPIDLVEWRVDFFNDVFEIEKVKEVSYELAKVLCDIPILFTFRTAKEGGEKDITLKYYFELYKEVASINEIDLIDIELFSGDDFVKDLIEAMKIHDIKVILSNHDFEKTPSKDTIIERLVKMQSLGADIPKIAVMPNSKLDVLELLEATAIMTEKYADRPIITMSMKGEGVISRISGEVFGSAVTFGSVGKASAPGQIDAIDLKNALNLLHEYI